MNKTIYPARNENAWWDLLGNDIVNTKNDILKQINDMKKQGKIIFPKYENIFNALKLTHPNDVKVVIIGQDPYHEINQAMGLSFSVPKGIALPPSLCNIYTELCNDINCQYPKNGDLTKWAEQGVLLLNTVLTVENHKANSHKDIGWQKITGEIIKKCLRLPQPIVFICWGSQAINTIEACIDDVWGLKSNHKILRSSHPSPLSAYKSSARFPAFFGSRHFSKTNSFLIKNKIEPIDWAIT